MTASNPELIPLIYRYLKEHGFHTAAEELQKQSLQSEPPTSATLLDIYSSWLRSSKRKTKPATSKRSAPDKKQTTPKKASPHKKKTDNATKQPGSPNKKSPKKQKKSDGKAVEKNVKSSKSKSQKKKADGGEDSDSDSSLDVEKWKRLVEQMTDADLAKVEALDALVAPVPKKPRVRKPRAKPKPKTETPADGQDQHNKTSDTCTGDTLPKSNPPKKSRPKKVPVETLGSSSQNIEAPVATVISTPKHSPKKEKRKATTDQATIEPKQKKKKTPTSDNDIVNATDVIIDKGLDHNEDPKTGNPTEIKPTDQSGPKKEKEKKKKKDATQNKATTYSSGGVIDKNIDGIKDAKTSNPALKVTEGNQDSSSNLQTEPKKKKKKDSTQNKVTANASSGDIDKNVDSINDAKISNPTTELKKGSKEKTFNSQAEPKKKKIEKEVKVTSDVLVDHNVEQNTVEDLNGNLVAEDLTSSLNTANAESVEKPKKKKKKKDKTKQDGEQTVTEAKTNSVTNEGNCETTAVESSQDTVETDPKKKKKKKKKKDQDKEESETLQQGNVIAETVGVEENTQQIIVEKKSKKKIKEGGQHLGTEGERVKTPMTQSCDGKVQEETPEAPPTKQTPSLKKKKHKLQTEDLAKAEESETPKKKKKTSSKNKETKLT